MLRRLLTSAAVVLALAMGTSGCADDVSPAASYADSTISHDELMEEVEEWAKSPRLIELFLGAPAAATEGSFDSRLVAVVLSNRISFDVYRAEFEARDLRVDDGLLEQVRQGIFQDPADSMAVLDQLDPAFGDALVMGIARQFLVQSELGESIADFEAEAFGDVEINPRYGRWDPAAGGVIPPDGPRPAPVDDLTAEL